MRDGELESLVQRINGFNGFLTLDYQVLTPTRTTRITYNKGFIIRDFPCQQILVLTKNPLLLDYQVFLIPTITTRIGYKKG